MKIAVISLTILLAATLPAGAQMTTEQRVFDFQALASLYAKHYAPMSWKRQTVNFDGLNIAPWLPRVRAAKDDVEFLELCKEYVASFDDLHTTFYAPGSLVIDSGISTDIYDGKVLVDFIDRTMLPRAQYPIEIGDEVVAVDGRPVNEALADIMKIQKMGNPSTTRRYAAEILTFRYVGESPRAVLLGDNLVLQLKQTDGETRSFTLPWVKRGYAPSKIGPVPSPRAEPDSPEFDLNSFLISSWNQGAQWKLRDNNWLVKRAAALERDPGRDVEGWVLGWGTRSPSFGAPAGFQQRLGRSGADFHYSGTYMSEGKRIGFLRIPDFAPASTLAASRELAGEIAFFRQNTDGLVVDVSRNPGGGCYALTVASYLIPDRFWFFGEELRPTVDLITAYQSTLELARRLRVEQWLIDTIEFQIGMIKTAYEENRGVTGPIPACSFTFENEPARDQAGRVIAYEKPVVVLIDEFSTSAGDIFPAMMQDNKRGVLVGKRTNGAGGRINESTVGFYMEGAATHTDSLVTRREPRAVQGYPTSYYIENVGVHPDIELERMTVENLRNNGRPYADAFTRILVEEINKAAR